MACCDDSELVKIGPSKIILDLQERVREVMSGSELSVASNFDLSRRDFSNGRTMRFPYDENKLTCN